MAQVKYPPIHLFTPILYSKINWISSVFLHFCYFCRLCPIFYVNIIMSTTETTLMKSFIIFDYTPRYWGLISSRPLNVAFARIPANIARWVNKIYLSASFVQNYPCLILRLEECLLFFPFVPNSAAVPLPARITRAVTPIP